MQVPSLDLRFKIFLGSGLLIVPLVVTLAFLVHYETALIQAALDEEGGVTVTRPLVDTLVGWASLGPGAAATPELKASWAEAARQLEAHGPALGFHQEGFRSGGMAWVAPGDLAALVAGGPGDQASFRRGTEALTNAVVYLADTSGLVLDPDLDSYYLMLAIYQELPDLVTGLAGLEVYTKNESFSAADRLNLFSLAQQVQSAAQKLGRQVTLSVRYVDRGWAPVPGYREAMAQALPPLVDAADRLHAEAEALANGDAEAGAQALASRLEAVEPLVAAFHQKASPALEAMIEGRVALFQQQLAVALVSALVGLVLATVVLFVIGTGVRRRSGLLVRALGSLAEGDLTLPVEPRLLASGDELGRLARSVHQLRLDLAGTVTAIAEVNAQLANLGSTLAATAQESASAIEEMAATSAQVAHAATSQLAQTELAAKTVQAIIQGISESSDLTQSMAGQFFMFSQAMEASRRRIQATSAEAQVTGGLAEALSRTGSEGERSMELLRSDIVGVVQRSQEIQDIVKFILDISERTNLLSMNAGIEAAHAGASGRGFKVVADEIRKLAEVSGTQAQNIRELVDSITVAAAQTLSRAETTEHTFASLSRDIGQVKNAAQAIAQQIVDQEAQDRVATAGLEEFTRFYTDLSGTMEVQVSQSADVHQALASLKDTSRQITGSMNEQKIGMDQATAAVVQVRDTSTDVARILDELSGLLGRFRL